MFKVSRQTKLDFYSDNFRNVQSAPEFLKLNRRLRPAKSAFPELEFQDALITDTTAKAKVMSDFFAGNFNDSDIDFTIPACVDTVAFATLSIEEVRSA